MPPVIRVVLVATVNGTPEVLVDGVMTNHQVTPASNGYSNLVIIGEDLTRLMDYLDWSGVSYAGTDPSIRVRMILTKYAAFGVIPLVIPPFLYDVENPLQYIPLHQGTDLDYIKCLAKNVGHVFYVEAGPAPLTSKAYRDSAAGSQHQHGCAHELRVAEF
jgi:hypothetical protein